ncbi:Protein kinase C gamma type (Fragment) [Seminavis robusta]|uniref:Protein kinase C gamma type n=1 Tax=Seminavis robusta TaxID=568900 RepID=A0A9N8DI82_9STRA
MEELQDAIEDAQYVNAISTQEDGPRPVLPWEIPTEEQLAEWETKCKEQSDGASGRYGEPLSFEWYLSSAVGFFHFSSFVKSEKDDYVRINFVEEVLRFQKSRGKTRVEKARFILSNYLQSPKRNFDNGEPELPPRTEIEELDLDRKPSKLGMTSEEFQTLCNQSIDSENLFCCVGLKGAVRDELITSVQSGLDRAESIQKAESVPTLPAGDDPARQRPSVEGGGKSEPLQPTSISSESMRDLTRRLRTDAAGDMPSDIFNKAEAVVFEALRRQYYEAFKESIWYTKLRNFIWFQDRRVVPEDFFVMRVLGRGGFGLVTACKKGTSGQLYAMKVMNKKRIKMKKSEQLALNERKALAAVESRFVVNLKYSFHSKDDVFLILDLMTGGDLGYHLHQKGKFHKRECLYYAARIMLGLQALHDQQYVYRDLKPENCLLAEDGRVKITDLGLATKITPTLHGAAGTRGYWAPEMLKRDKNGRRMPYGHAVDWFSFGCCVAEFISGSNPFRSEAALNFGLERGKQTKEKAIDCATQEMDPEFNPEKFDPEAADLCKRLLDKNHRTRLGANGCEEIMAHPWFRRVKWEEIISDKKKPPYTPPKDVNAAPQSEIGTFTEDKALQEIVIDERDEEVYKSWDWTNPRAFAAEVIEFLIYERTTGEPLLPIAQNASCCCNVL